jgi:type I restriction enzyme M protein
MGNGATNGGTINRDILYLIWSIAELLRGPYKESEYGKVVLPFTVLRRLDCVLAPTKKNVLEQKEKAKDLKLKDPDLLLRKASGQNFYNASRFDFPKLLADPNNIKDNLRDYINGFSPNAREIMERFDFDTQIEKLDAKDRLYAVVARFADAQVDLSPSVVSNEDMGRLYEELIRRFAEQSNETAGEHFTPREVIRLMVNLLFVEERDVLIQKGIVKTLYDPACGTGGMLSVAEEYVQELNPTPDWSCSAGGQRRVVRRLQVRHAHQGIQPEQHPARGFLHERPVLRREVRLHAFQSPVRGGMEAGPEVHRGRA